MNLVNTVVGVAADAIVVVNNITAGTSHSVTLSFNVTSAVKPIVDALTKLSLNTTELCVYDPTCLCLCLRLSFSLA